MALPQRYIENEIEKEFFTEEEYFAFERRAFGRWEYVGGRIRQMSGGTADHGAISSNVLRALGNALVPRGCRVYGSDVKMHCGDGTNTFPDVSVVCEQNRYYQGRKDIILNPLLVVEVLSPSTEGYDRGEKFEHFQTIPSLTDYLLVSQHEPRVTHYHRLDDGWEYHLVGGLDGSVTLASLEVTLALADVYALIEFGEGNETP